MKRNVHLFWKILIPKAVVLGGYGIIQLPGRFYVVGEYIVVDKLRSVGDGVSIFFRKSGEVAEVVNDVVVKINVQPVKCSSKQNCMPTSCH